MALIFMPLINFLLLRRPTAKPSVRHMSAVRSILTTVFSVANRCVLVPMLFLSFQQLFKYRLFIFRVRNEFL